MAEGQTASSWVGMARASHTNFIALPGICRDVLEVVGGEAHSLIARALAGTRPKLDAQREPVAMHLPPKLRVAEAASMAPVVSSANKSERSTAAWAQKFEPRCGEAFSQSTEPTKWPHLSSGGGTSDGYRPAWRHDQAQPVSPANL